MTAAPRQLEFPLELSPRDAGELLARLRTMGLCGIERCRLTANRAVMVSFAGTELRVQRAYLDAPRWVHEAIVRLVNGRTRAARGDARRVILAHRVPDESAHRRGPRRPPPMSDRDARVIARLDRHHAELNARHFGGALGPVAIRLSDRMHTRLGHYAPATAAEPAHIAISRRHLRRHGWSAALETLLHEMIHQWQSERGLPLDHRRPFRDMARRLGIPAVAERRAPTPETRSAPSPLHPFFGAR
jgi:SprT-like family